MYVNDIGVVAPNSLQDCFGIGAVGHDVGVMACGVHGRHQIAKTEIVLVLETDQEDFLRALKKEKVSVTLRREKGHDIDAACGQLRLRTERETLATASG